MESDRLKKMRELVQAWESNHKNRNELHAEFTETSTFREGGVAYAAFGLAGETGECLEEFKKWVGEGHDPTQPIRPNHPRFSKFLDELSDVLWYVTRLARHHGASIESLQHHNMYKLVEKHKEMEREASKKT